MDTANSRSAVTFFRQVLENLLGHRCLSGQLFQCGITFVVKRAFWNTQFELCKLHYIAVEKSFVRLSLNALQTVAGSY